MRELTNDERALLAVRVANPDSLWANIQGTYPAEAEGMLAEQLSAASELLARMGSYSTRAERDAAAAVISPTAAQLVAQVKSAANRRIEAVYPDFKQRNMTARGVELVRNLVQNGGWTAGETIEAAALDAAWAWIKGIRAKSDEMEASIAAMNDAQRSAFDVSDNANWG